MIKKIKRIKLNFLKKKQIIKNTEKSLILKSINNNLSVSNERRFFVKIKMKKKLKNYWLNTCFYLGLHKKLFKKLLLTRFTLKKQNNNLNIPNVAIIK